jgi:hypothetical protein
MTRQLFQYDPAFGYRFIPGQKARVAHEGGGYLLRANGAGFRCDHEVVPAKAPGTFRILLFGDSYTAGDGVSNKHRFGDVLEQLVPGVEVLNFGLPGSGTDQQYLIYREVAPPIEHDLVVIAVLVENIRRIVARFRPYQAPDGSPILLAKPYFTLADDGELALHNVPVPRDPLTAETLPEAERGHVDRGGRLVWLRELVNRAGPRAKEWAQRITRFQPLPAYGSASDPAWRLMRAILERWLAEIKTPVLICPIPLYQYVEGTSSPKPYLARFAELSDPPRVRIHDPLPDLWRHTREARRGFRFGEDPHPTPAGHRALAESLARPVRALLEGRLP